MANASSIDVIPRLESGDHLTRDEFERRYKAMPHLKKAELIDGVVYVGSPVRFEEHGWPQSQLIWWLTHYALLTPGVRVADNASVRLEGDNELQPDGLLFCKRGQATVAEDGILEGAPELVAEVTASSASHDLHSKLNVYRRNGVREYLVWRVLDAALDWFVLRKKRYQPLKADPTGILRSEAFPGLWLDPAALLRGEGPRILAVLQQGLASPEHTAFVTKLQQSKSS